jgi:hypothetical protein
MTLADETGSLTLRVISAPAFLATKLEAFASRGGGDLTHPDIEDIVYLIDGRKELVSEVESAVEELRAFVAESVKALFDAGLEDRVSTHLRGDFASQSREPIVVATLRRLAAL